MWQTDTITLQTATPVNTNGCIKNTWATLATVTCDVQDIDKEKVLKEYGFTDCNDYKQIFDFTMNASWSEGDQCSYGGKQYLIKKVILQTKIGLSNHYFIVLGRVV